MNKEDDNENDDDAPLHRTDNAARDREASVGDGFEAPKRPRTTA